LTLIIGSNVSPVTHCPSASERVTSVPLSVVIVWPLNVWTATLGCWANATPAVAVPDGCWMKTSFGCLIANGASDRSERMVVES